MTNKNIKKKVNFKSTQSKALRIPAGKPQAQQQAGVPKRGSTQAYSQRSSRSSAFASMPQFTMAQIDPFAEESFGTKVPDDSTAPTATAFSRNLLPITVTTANPGMGQLFRYHPANWAVNPTGVTGTTWTWGTAYAGATVTSNIGALKANYTALKTVAWGLKISCRQNYAVATGMVHIAHVPDVIDGSTWSYPTSVSALEYAPYYRRIPVADLIQDDVIVNGRFTDATAFRFIDPAIGDAGSGTLAQANFPTPGWLGIMVWYEGNTTIADAIDIEYLAHYEGLPQTTSGTSGVIAATKCSPYSPTVLAATSFVGENTEPIRVTSECNENSPEFWATIEGVYNRGIQIANGVKSALRTAGYIATLI